MQDQTTAPETVEAETAIIRGLVPLRRDEAVVFIDGGWDSRVYMAGDRYVFKFPRNGKIKGRYAHEIAALQQVSTLGGPVTVPHVVITHPENDYFAYESVPGVLLDDEAADITAAGKEAIGRTLGMFLRSLHQLQLDGARDMGPQAEITQSQDWFERNRQAFAELFSESEVSGLQSLVYGTWPAELREAGSDIVLCHGDFHLRNILKTGDGRLGVIDFGDVCHADRSKDFVHLDDETIFEAALQAYGDSSREMRRRIAIRRQMFSLMRLSVHIGKGNRAGVLRMVEHIRTMLPGRQSAAEIR